MVEGIQEYAFSNTFRCSFESEDYKSLDRSVISISTPNLTLGVTDQQAIPRPIKIPGNSFEIGEVSIDFMLDQDFANWIKIFNWLNTLQNFTSVVAEQDVIDISINLLDNKSNYISSIVLEDCFPTNLSEITFDTQIDEPQPQQFTVQFTTNHIKID